MRLDRPFSELSEDVFVLHEKMFPLYFVRGEKNFLIDTSINAFRESIYTKLLTLLDGKKLDFILLTHSHYDHTGSLPFLQDKFCSKISGSERTIELLKKQDVRDFVGDMNTRFNKVLGINRKAEFPEPIDLFPLNEGDKIRIDKHRYFKIIETPGHTKCSASFLLLPQKILFPGDAAGVLEKNNKPKPLFLSDYNSYTSSLEKLINLNAEILCPPHNSYIRGQEKVCAHLKRSLESAIDLKNKILTALESGSGINEVSELILETEFPHPVVEGPEKAFKINLNSMVHAVFKLRENKIN